MIGHMKNDGRLTKSPLQGTAGDRRLVRQRSQHPHDPQTTEG
jgi:hypothetical protein